MTQFSFLGELSVPLSSLINHTLCIEIVLHSAGMETLPSNLMLFSEEIIFGLTGSQPSQKGQKEYSHASSSFSFDSLKP